jgi:hypothetical protein
VREQEAHTLTVVRPSYGLGQRGADIDDAQAVGQQLLLLAEGHGVGDNQSLQLAALDDVDGVAAQDAVGDDGDDLLSAVRDEGGGGLGQRAAGVGHVVDEDAGHVLDGADQDHAGDFVGARALLVDQGEGKVEAVGDGGRAGKC